MTEEQIKSIEYLKEYIKTDKENIEICEENDFYEEAKHINERVKHFETILNLIEKQQNKIKDVKIRLEYYLMGNLSFNKEAQKEFERLLKMLEE